MYRIIVLFIVTILFSACRKESETFKCVREPLFDFKNECKSLKHIAPDFRIIPITDVGDIVATPTYSPLDPSLIAFVRNGKRLVIFNKETDTEIFESPEIGLITRKPDWGENNVISVPTYPSQQVHFFDVNTSNFKSVRLGKIQGVEWLNHSEIIYFKYAGKYGWHLLKYDYYAKQKDTIIAKASDLNGARLSYNKGQGKLLKLGASDLEYFNYHSNTSHKGPLKSKFQGRDFFVWHPFEDRVYYTQKEKGLFYYDYSRQKEVRVKKNCDSWFYSTFDFTPDGNKIVAELHQKWVDKAPEGIYNDSEKDDWYYVNSHIVEFDLDGCNDKVIIEGKSK